MIIFLVTLLLLFLGSEGFAYRNGAVRNVQGNTSDPYVFIGHNLSLWCHLSITDVDANSKLMYFTKGKDDTIIPMDYITIVNTKTVQLNYPISSVNDEANYVCKLNSTTHRVVGNQFVKVEYETKPAQNITCLVYNWENMTCTLQLGVPYKHMEDMKVQLIWRIMKEKFHCPHMSAEKTSCSWKKFDGNDSFKSQQIYHMVVRVKNKKDPMKRRKTTERYKINTSLIVKPAPVENLSITYGNTTCARISWQHSAVFAIYLYYEITYSSQWDKKQKSSTTTDTEIAMCNLMPYTNYTFRVRCKPTMEGYWSEITELLYRTAEDVPAGAPLMEPGSYTEYHSSTVGCREVLIYWKSMSLQKQNGEIVEYILNITSINTDGVVEAQYPRHILKDRNSFKLTLESSKKYEIRLLAATGVGISNNFSSLFISSHDYNLPSPKQFVVEASAEENKNTTMHFSWREPVVTDDSMSVVNFTLYWCEGSVQRVECDGELNWISLPAHQTTYKMYDFPRDYDNYMFGIAVNVVTQSGNIISRGLKWSDCTYKVDAVPQFPPRNVRVTLLGQDIQVDWDPYDCLESRGYVISYLIRYCVLADGNVCSGQTIISVDGDDVHHLLQGLTLEKTYNITVSSNTSAGEGRQSLPLKIAMPFTGIRTETLAGIVVTVLVVIILAVVGLCYLCRKFLKWKKKCDVPKNLEDDFRSSPDLTFGESFDGYHRGKYLGYSEIQSTTSTFLPAYNDGQNPKISLYKGDKPREYTSSTRSLLHISDDNSEMSEQNKGQCDNSHGKPSGAVNSFSETDHDYEDTDEVVSEFEELKKNTKNKTKKACSAAALRNDMKLRLNPLYCEDGPPHQEILKNKLKWNEDSDLSDIPTLEKLPHKNRTIGPYTQFGSAGSVAHPANASSASSYIPAYSRFGSCGELVGGYSSHYMPQNVMEPTPVSAVPKDIGNITDNNNKSSDLIQSLHDQLTLQRRERRIPDLKLAPSGQYYTLEQVNEKNSSSSSSSPQSSLSSEELENRCAQNRCRPPDNSESTSVTNSLSNSGESTQKGVYIPVSEVIRTLPKNCFEDRIHQNHMPLTLS